MPPKNLHLTAGCIACLWFAAGPATAGFIAADFEFAIQTDPTFRAGDVVVFDGLLTNVSSRTAVFGQNISIAGASYFTTMDGIPGPASPYFEGLSAAFFPDQSLAAGASIEFPFVFIDTSAATPPGVAVTAGPGNFLFRNIPPSTSQPYVDFFIPFPSASAVSISVPEPAMFPLFGIGILAVCAWHRWYGPRHRGGDSGSMTFYPDVSSDG